MTATLAEVYKQGGRPQLLAIAPQVWQLLLGLLDSEAARNSVTSRCRQLAAAACTGQQGVMVNCSNQPSSAPKLLPSHTATAEQKLLALSVRCEYQDTFLVSAPHLPI